MYPTIYVQFFPKAMVELYTYIPSSALNMEVLSNIPSQNKYYSLEKTPEIHSSDRHYSHYVELILHSVSAMCSDSLMLKITWCKSDCLKLL